MLTSLHEPQLLQGYYEQFLKQIKQYQNIQRTGVFVRYFNINVPQSIYEKTLESTLDVYPISEVRFDIHELTPVFFIGPVQNSVSNVMDLDGQRVDGASTITLYTIKRPRIHDLLSFTHPIESGEIFRVTGLRTATNLLHSSPNIDWFEADIDYAPLKDLNSLKTENRYVYDMSIEQNLPYDKYLSKLEWLNELSDLLNEAKKYYNIRDDVYRYNQYIPVILNELMILIKKYFNNNWYRLLDDFSSPYGYTDYCSISYNTLDEIKFPEDNIGFQMWDTQQNQMVTYLLGQDPEMDFLINLSKNLHNKVVGSLWIKTT
jgi:hypothetical protein